MLAAVGHARERQPVVQALREQRDDARVAMERAIADHLRMPVVEIEHGREAHVDPAGAQLGGQDVADRGGDLGREQHVAIPQIAEPAHRRQHREAVGAEPLDAAAFVIDRDQDVLAHRADRVGQRAQLRAVFEMPREQDHAAGVRMRKAPRIVARQGRADDVEHDRAGSRFHRIGKSVREGFGERVRAQAAARRFRRRRTTRRSRARR